MKSGVRYTSTADSPVGYGSAARAFITALFSVGIDVTCEIIYQMPHQTDYGWTGSLCKNLQDRNIPYKIKILHLTPDTAIPYMEEGIYHISHLFWETDKLPSSWIEPLNKMGEVWTSSSTMADLFKASGVKVPIYFFPQPIDIAEGDKNYGKFEIDGHKGFLFYSIFQWIERKNPKGLLTAYWEAFQGRDDVTLLLKTYRINYTKMDQEEIQTDIRKWKRELALPHYPRIIFIPDLLTHDEIMKLHNSCDVYVTANHGEGWDRVLQEALLMGKPTISTARGGLHEYLNSDYYFPISSTYVPVTPVSWIPYYGEDQQWAEPDKKELIKTMQYVFGNKELAQIKGVKAKDYIKDNFSFYKVGMMMRKRLEDIYKGL